MRPSHSTTEQIGFDRLEPGLNSLFQQGCQQLGLACPAKAEQQLSDHLMLLVRWNKRLNLTAIVSPREMLVQHVLDSLAVTKLLKGQRIIDIGSGGGFPGMPLAAIFPEREFTLLDSRGKRVEFLRHASATIGLKNVKAVQSRIEDFRPGVKFDTLIARAFSSLSDMFFTTRHLHSAGSTLLAMKGRHPDREIEGLRADPDLAIQVEPIEVPFLEAQRHAVIIDF